MLRIPLHRYSWAWFVYLAFLISKGGAQDMTHYQPLEAQGKVPAYFQIAFLEKFNPFITATDSTSLHEGEEEFWEESNQYINQLLLSGKVIYNDPVTDYINQVADHLLRKNASLRRKLRFFAVKSPSMNAFSSNHGVVLVNLGLIARLENEAQLAFILSHEISHIVYKHQRDTYLASQNLETQIQELKDHNRIKQLLLEHQLYSQKTEHLADKEGLRFLMKSAYSSTSLPRCFDLILSPSEPLPEFDFDWNFLGIDSVEFPPSYLKFPKQSSPQELLGYSLPHASSETHPSAKDRKELLENLLKQKKRGSSLQKDYLVGKTEFEHIREICRFETCLSFQAEHQHEMALLWAFQLLQKHPENEFLRKLLVNTLYGLSKYKLTGRFFDVHQNYEELSGNAQQIAYTLEQLLPEEMLILALRYSWKIHRKFPEDEEVALILQDLVHNAESRFPGLLVDPKKTTDPNGISFSPLLVPLLSDDAFIVYLEKVKYERGVEQKNSREALASKVQPFSLDQNLGIDELAVVNPTYFKIDERFTRTEQIEQANRQAYHVQSILKKHAKLLDLRLVLLSNTDPDVPANFELEDILLLSKWFAEINQGENQDMISLYHNEVQHLVDKYQVTHFMWLEAGSFARSPSGKGIILSAGILLPVLLPYSILFSQTPKHMTFIYAKVYDLTTGKEVAYFPQKLVMKDRLDVLRSAIYNLMYQIKGAP